MPIILLAFVVFLFHAICAFQLDIDAVWEPFLQAGAVTRKMAPKNYHI